MKSLTKEKMLTAFRRLDELLPRSANLLVGGGGAMLLSYNFPLATADIDGIPSGVTMEEMDIFIKQITQEQGLSGDWLNPYFSSFTHVLPGDYKQRLVPAFSGQRLTVHALGKEDLLVMKCFAHRRKDVPHARALVRQGARVAFVGQHIEQLKQKNIPKATEALDFLDEIIELET